VASDTISGAFGILSTRWPDPSSDQKNPGSQTPNPSMHQRVYANPMPRFPNPKSVSIPVRTRQPSNPIGLGGLHVRCTPVCFASQVGLALGHQLSCLAPKRFLLQNETNRRGLRSDVGINIGELKAGNRECGVAQGFFALQTRSRLKGLGFGV
jgi:hypothetical protein